MGLSVWKAHDTRWFLHLNLLEMTRKESSLFLKFAATFQRPTLFTWTVRPASCGRQNPEQCHQWAAVASDEWPGPRLRSVCTPPPPPVVCRLAYSEKRFFCDICKLYPDNVLASLSAQTDDWTILKKTTDGTHRDGRDRTEHVTTTRLGDNWENGQ